MATAKKPRDPNAPPKERKPRGAAKPRKSLIDSRREELAKLEPKLAKARDKLAKAKSKVDDTELEYESVADFIRKYEERHPQPAPSLFGEPTAQA